MTSAAKMAANQRNALKSTGPRTPKGKANSSRNALKHGLNAKIDAKDVLKIYREILDDEMADPSLAMMEERPLKALRLALAEARLNHVREREQELMYRYRGYFEDQNPDEGMIQMLTKSNFCDPKMTRREAISFMRRFGLGQNAATYTARNDLRLIQRYVSEAETSHSSAVHEWCESEMQFPETKPNNDESSDG